MINKNNNRNKCENNKWADLAHDIRSPLSVIITAAELIESPDPKIQKNIKRITDNVEKIDKILDQSEKMF